MKYGLCKGRHDMPVDDYIFENELDVFDFELMYNKASIKIKHEKKIELYVTGLTSALVEVINVCIAHRIELDLYHYDRKKDEYCKQITFTHFGTRY